MGMASSSFSSSPLVAFSFIALCFFLIFLPAHGFRPGNSPCEKCVAHVIFKEVNDIVSKEPRTGASLLRLHFHDCFVNGCDASVLLNDTEPNEQNQSQNKMSIRKMEVIDKIREQARGNCSVPCGKGVVSCADVLAIAARDSVVALNGPWYNPGFGRVDSAQSYPDKTKDIPSPKSDLSTLIKAFAAKDLSVTDMVALSGAHTIGMARCENVRTALNAKACHGKGVDNNIIPLDVTPTVFDKKYYEDLRPQNGVLPSDEALRYDATKEVQDLVLLYSRVEDAFFKDFANAMFKMGWLPSGGDTNQRRRRCYTNK